MSTKDPYSTNTSSDISPEAQVSVYSVRSSETGMRLDRWLAARFNAHSRRWWQGEIDAGLIRIDRKPGAKGSILSEHQTIEIRRSARPISPIDVNSASIDNVWPEDIAIIHEDEQMLAVSKPSGLACHPLSQSELLAQPEKSLMGRLFAARPELAFIIPEGVDRSIAGRIQLQGGLLHRLDNQSSGILLIAKHYSAWSALSSAVQGRNSVPEAPQEFPQAVSKFYIARVDSPGLSRSDLPKFIDAPIAHQANRSGNSMVAVTADCPGSAYRGKPRPARTRIHHIMPGSNKHSYILVEIHRGQRHQIRCHLASIGLALSGDGLYGGSGAPINFLLHHCAFGMVDANTSQALLLSDRNGLLRHIDGNNAKFTEDRETLQSLMHEAEHVLGRTFK